MLLPRILTVLLGFTLFVSEALTQDTLDDETATEEDPGSEESTSTIASDSVTRDFVVDLHSLLKTLRREAYPYISELMADDKMSRDCMGSLLALARGIQEEERWALMSEYCMQFPHIDCEFCARRAAGNLFVESLL